MSPSPYDDLDPPAIEKSRLTGGISERVIRFLETLPEQPAWSNDHGSDAPSWVRGPVPEEGAGLEETLATLFERVIPCALNTAGPGYLAYVPGGGLYSAALAEFLAAAVNRYAGVWIAAPGAVELETQVIRWLVELLGLPPGSLGLLTTGGSMSNLIALVAARGKLLGETFDDGTLYVSREVHHCVTKAARIAGIRESRCRTIPVDAALRMRVDLLEEAIRNDRGQGLRPFFVCASAGTVNTGAVDPLSAIAAIARREKLWFHVDGAYGGVFRMVPELADVLSGMEEADSVAIDPHKGLFLAYGTGALLVRDPADLRQAYRSSAAYLPEFQDGQQHVDFCEISPELSRDWRGLRLWLPFKLHGVGAFRRALREKRELAVLAYERLAAQPDVEVAAPPELSLFAFRKRWPGVEAEEEDRRNRELLGRINAPRRVYLTGTNLDGRFYLRICVLHLRTHRDRVEEGLEIIRRELQA
jgi:aromatic-L-amino-acid decarboxylase